MGWRGPTIGSVSTYDGIKRTTTRCILRVVADKARPGSVFRKTHPLAAASVCGSVTLEETELECSKIEALEPDLPRSSYLRFVASLYGREYLGALDHLHRYFDYAGSKGGPVSPRTMRKERGVWSSMRPSTWLVYMRFGHARLASCALDEAVRVAQQRHDHACVTFALGWLRYVDIREAEYEAETYGPPLPGESTHTVDALSLQRCAKRAKQLGLRELESAALLCFARDALDYARTDECYEQEVLTRAYAPSKASRATLAAWKLAEDAAAFEAPGPRDGPDTSMLMQTPQQRLERERKERREGQQDPQGLPKDCEIKRPEHGRHQSHAKAVSSEHDVGGSWSRRRSTATTSSSGRRRWRGRLYCRRNKGTCRGSDGGAGLMKMIAVVIYRRTGRRAYLGN